MAIGELKWFDPKKGFGFIIPDNGTDDVFLHVSEVDRSGISFLREGDPISYEIGEDRRSGRPCAINISIPANTN
jgi:CspA family cold shock protein